MREANRCGHNLFQSSIYLSKFADVSDSLSFERLEIGGDPAVLEVHHTGERFVEQGPDGDNRKIAGFGLKHTIK